MRHIGNALFILAAASTVAAIWSPVGAWWQFLATAVLLFLAGALAHGTHLAAQKPAAAPKGTSPARVDVHGYTPEEVGEYIQRDYEKHRRLNYGQKAAR